MTKTLLVETITLTMDFNKVIGTATVNGKTTYISQDYWLEIDDRGRLNLDVDLLTDITHPELNA